MYLHLLETKTDTYKQEDNLITDTYKQVDNSITDTYKQADNSITDTQTDGLLVKNTPTDKETTRYVDTPMEG